VAGAGVELWEEAVASSPRAGAEQLVQFPRAASVAAQRAKHVDEGRETGNAPRRQAGRNGAGEDSCPGAGGRFVPPRRRAASCRRPPPPPTTTMARLPHGGAPSSAALEHPRAPRRRPTRTGPAQDRHTRAASHGQRGELPSPRPQWSSPRPQRPSGAHQAHQTDRCHRGDRRRDGRAEERGRPNPENAGQGAAQALVQVERPGPMPSRGPAPYAGVRPAACSGPGICSIGMSAPANSSWGISRIGTEIVACSLVRDAADRPQAHAGRSATGDDSSLLPPVSAPLVGTGWEDEGRPSPAGRSEGSPAGALCDGASDSAGAVVDTPKAASTGDDPPVRDELAAGLEIRPQPGSTRSAA